MRPEIRRLTTEQFVSLLQAQAPHLTRKITAVHLHHTWRPTRSQFRGKATVEAMRNFHVNNNHWDDIAQHLTIDPLGLSWTGRNWNLPPASQAGKNGTRHQGPFMIEIVGDFDAGRDPLDGAQRQAVIDVVGVLLQANHLGTADVLFHRELGSPKTCPGTSVDKQTLIDEIDVALAAHQTAPGRRTRGAKKGAAGGRGRARLVVPFAAEFQLGRDLVAPPEDEAPPGYESWEIQESDLAARFIEEDARARVRAAMGGLPDLSSVLQRTKSEWEILRPHVVNLTEGRLSQSGEFDMPEGAIDGIIDAISRYVRTIETPRVMMHAHGGLVSEKSALRYARDSYTWWLAHGVFPVYFIWETSVFEIIKNRLGLTRGFGDWWDRRFEKIARPIGKPLWSEMKEYALLSSSPDAGEGDAGGALKFVQALAPLVRNPPDQKSIELHAVGHSAGAIFHAHFVPALFQAGLTVERLALLAPAVRIDPFKQMLVPRLGDGLNHVDMYTMDEEAERGDDLIEPIGIPIYGKSLLYLISGAFEPEDKHAAILGLEERFSRDLEIKQLFAAGGPHRLELSHAKGKPHNPATKSRKHGCFDNDDATMRSVLAGIIDATTEVPFPVEDKACDKASSRALAGWPVAVAPSGRSALGSGGGAARRALCVGIDSYPTSPLAGCVQDAQAWSRALGGIGFDVTTVLDSDATRQRVLAALEALVASARAGDTLVFQYAGHGTQADDLNGDESDRYDEALVPIDYQSGALLLDDDLAEIYRQLPDGAVLTLFMDCCHSGTNSRFAPFDRGTPRGSERRRFLPLTPENAEAHRRYRARAGSPTPTTAEESLPGVVHFAACLDNQYAYESDGQGHFTRVATASLSAAVSGGATNEDFGSTVATGVIAIGRPQTPRLMRLPAELAGRALLAGPVMTGGPVSPPGGVAPIAGDRAFDEWCLQFFEAGAAHWRQRLGR